jgi:hypothetical protein
MLRRASQRARILEQLETFTDARVERYWQLLAVVNGQTPPPAAVPAFDWLIVTPRADPSPRSTPGTADARST